MIGTRKKSTAFTLIELLVSIALTLLLVVMIGRLFTDTQAAVSQGVAMGRVIENSRGVGDQFARDFQGIVGPDDGGFMVISQQRDANGYRRDQIIFIKRAGGAEPLTPASPDNFANSFRADYSRVWLGHAERTNADGAGTHNEPNAERWILGRQELLLHGAFAPPLPNHAAGALASSAVSGYSGEPAPAGTGLIYMGMSDLSDVTLAQLTGNGSPVPPLTAASDPAYTNYRAAVYPYAFMANRMHTNPTPGNAWCYQVAQAHAYFSEGVSDFIIEMAGDFDTTSGTAGEVDRVPSGPEQGSIIWYSHFPDLSDPTQDQPPGTFGPYDNNPAAPYNSHAAAAFTFQHTTATFPNAKDHWPHMIRIRWRHHDPNGTLKTTTSIPNTPLRGRWFEQIFYVPRS